MNFFQKLSRAGIKSKMPLNLQKQILLTNRVNLFLTIAGFINLTQYALAGTYNKVLIFFPLELLLLSIPFINIKGHILASRLITSLIFPLYTLLGNIFFKTTLEDIIPFIEYLKPSLTITLYIIIPLCIFDPILEKKWYRLNQVLILITILAFDPLNNLFGVGINRSEYVWEGYNGFWVFRCLIWFGLSACVSSVKSVNYSYEEELRSSNQLLQSQKDEILSQNEELTAHQEEIIKQRTYIEQKNLTLSIKNQEVEKSVKTAKSIQEAVLPYKEKLDFLFKDYFILYKPRDIVSGDFIWVGLVENKIILSVMDCTGHGVPGAFITLIGNTLLDKIIRLRNITDPAAILNAINDDIEVMLNHDQKSSNGMDMSICVWENEENHINFSFEGAKSDIVYFEPRSNEPIQIKGTRKSIGLATDPKKKFTTKKRCLPTGTALYAYTDGILDQNNTDRNRFGRKNFIKGLVETQPLSFPKQKQKIDHIITDFSVNCIQRDDICVVGVLL